MTLLSLIKNIIKRKHGKGRKRKVGRKKMTMGCGRKRVRRVRRVRRRMGGSIKSIASSLWSGVQSAYGWAKKHKPATKILEYFPTAASLPYGIGPALTLLKSRGLGMRRRRRVRRIGKAYPHVPTGGRKRSVRRRRKTGGMNPETRFLNSVIPPLGITKYGLINGGRRHRRRRIHGSGNPIGWGLPGMRGVIL